MKRKNRLVRLFRALSGMTQRAFAARTRIHHVLLAGHELDGPEPSPEHLARAAEGAGLTVAAGEQVLDFAEALRQQRRRAGLGPDDLARDLAALSARVYQQLLRLPLPEREAAPGEQSLEEQWALLRTFPEEQQMAVIRIAPELRGATP
jgi:transcriptional regulator with XRE-family HTH domain